MRAGISFQVMSGFFYTYVLRCADGHLYIGATENLERRLAEHTAGSCTSTRPRRPVELVYFEACRDLHSALERERQLKTGFGRAYLKRRLAIPSGG